jgi:hypothetical protein
MDSVCMQSCTIYKNLIKTANPETNEYPGSVQSVICMCVTHGCRLHPCRIQRVDDHGSHPPLVKTHQLVHHLDVLGGVDHQLRGFIFAEVVKLPLGSSGGVRGGGVVRHE